MCGTKVVAMRIQPNGLLLALKGSSMHTNPSTSGIKYHKFVDNTPFSSM